MGIWAKKPFALAPGMGLNAYFTYSVVLGMGVPWQVALAAVFVEGIIFLLLSFTGIRTTVINAIPLSQKYAVGAGIGLFLTLIGLENAGIVVSSPATLVTLGAENLANPSLWVAIIALFIAAVLLTLRIRGALLISILAATIIAIPLGVTQAPEGILALPEIQYTFLKLDFQGLMSFGVIGVIFAFFMVDFFDTLGTVTGLSAKAGYLDKDGRIPDSDKILATDAIGTSFGALLGTSTTTTYIESASGIEEGGRTGFTAVVVGLLFIVIGLFVSPIAAIIPAAATAPALIIVGLLMMTTVRDINFEDYSESIPAFLVLTTIPFTFSIADGIGIGFISYVIIKAFSGKIKDIHPLMWGLAALFVLYFLDLGGLI
jgi:AGZA family xanthine/uracil permease-like MFS transporter